MSSGDPARARHFLEEAVRARPKWALAHLWLGVALSEGGELERARTELEQATTLSPLDIIAPLWTGRTLIDHQKADEALSALETLSSSSKARRNLHVSGYLSLARWCAEGTDKILEELGWKVPLGGGGLWGRWLLEIEQRFPGGPGTDFSPISAEPSSSVADRLNRWRARRRIERARLKLKGRSFEDALDQLEAAEMLWSEAPEIPELRIKAHHGAVNDREKRLEAESNDVELRLDAAEDYLELGLARDALRILSPVEELITSLEPSRLSWRASLALLRGRALLGIDAFQEAIEALAAARELLPVELEPIYYFAVALLRAGRLHEGRRACISACSMDSELVQHRLLEYREAVQGIPESVEV